MSFDKLKGQMTEAHVSQAKLSEHLGITVQSLNAKLNGRTQFTLEEAIKITAFLNLKDPVDILEEMKKEVEKMKDQIKSLRLYYLILSICFIMATIGLLIRCFWIQQSLSGVHQLILLMYRAVQML